MFIFSFHKQVMTNKTAEHELTTEHACDTELRTEHACDTELSPYFMV